MRVILVLLLSGLCLGAAAQRLAEPRITADFRGYTMTRLAVDLQQRTGYRLYFDHQVDSIPVNIEVTQKTVSEILAFLLEGTGYVFSIDQDRNVFIAKGKRIVTGLPPGFFGYRIRPEMTDTVQARSAPVARDTNGLQVATLENKLYEIGKRSDQNGQVHLTGRIRDLTTGEPVIGASVYIENPRIGVFTDSYGYFNITLPRGRHTLFLQSIGMRDTRRQLQLRGEGTLDIDMQEEVIALKNVTISTEKAGNIKGIQMGVQTLDIRAIKQVPTVFGETDILRVVLTLPGVKSVGEASTGFNVRGGSADQNLILFNDCTIYNPSHFFGLFSAFNPDAVKDIQLYKSSIPARYGGRLASVLDVEGREGNNKKFTGTAGIGLLTSRVNIEGPLVKDKSSFIFGVRGTYANWLLQALPSEYKNSRASFYDANLLVTHQINNNNTLYFTGYFSQDNFHLNSDTTYGYGNRNGSIKWKHSFSNKVSMTLTAAYDRYQYSIGSTQNPVNAYKLNFDVGQFSGKADFNYYLNARHTLQFGVSGIYYQLDPGTYTAVGNASLVRNDTVPREQAVESAAYLSDRFQVTDRFSVEGGIRYSGYSYLGPQDLRTYASGLPKTSTSMTGVTHFGSGESLKTYGGPEFRLSARYSITSSFSVKAGYNSQRQYIHVLSNTASIAPTDIYKLSDANIAPQRGDQVSIGFYKNFKANTIETSVEAYYKNIDDYLDYRSGAQLVLNHHVETEVIETRGKAYGMEVQLKKTQGKLNGWISYTWSRILLRENDPTDPLPVNGGAWYPANYDKPHDITAVTNYRFSHRFSVSFNATYSTGRPITLPVALYYYGGSQRVLYSDRNIYRIPDYFRTDLSVNIEGNHKVRQKIHGSWTFGVYNLTGRKNPYSVYFVSEAGVVNGYKLSIFGNAIPFVNYNIRF